MKKLIIIFMVLVTCTNEEVSEIPSTTLSTQISTTTSTSTTTGANTSISKIIIEPKVEFVNCPSSNISNENYELKFQIDSGSGSIVSIVIFEQKNGESNKNVFFDKEYSDDIFTFPEANTVNEYSYVVDNVGNTKESN